MTPDEFEIVLRDARQGIVPDDLATSEAMDEILTDIALAVSLGQDVEDLTIRARQQYAADN